MSSHPPAAVRVSWLPACIIKHGSFSFFSWDFLPTLTPSRHVYSRPMDAGVRETCISPHDSRVMPELCSTAWFKWSSPCSTIMYSPPYQPSVRNSNFIAKYVFWSNKILIWTLKIGFGGFMLRNNREVVSAMKNQATAAQALTGTSPPRQDMVGKSSRILTMRAVPQGH